jgi:hypothetical protein
VYLNRYLLKLSIESEKRIKTMLGQSQHDKIKTLKKLFEIGQQGLETLRERYPEYEKLFSEKGALYLRKAADYLDELPTKDKNSSRKWRHTHQDPYHPHPIHHYNEDAISSEKIEDRRTHH